MKNQHWFGIFLGMLLAQLLMVMFASSFTVLLKWNWACSQWSIPTPPAVTEAVCLQWTKEKAL